MKSIPETVKEIVFRSPYLIDAIKKDILNLSSYARLIKPEIEDLVFKDVSEASIIMALKRLSINLKYQKNHKRINFSKYISNISLKSGLFETTYNNSPTLYSNIEKIFSKLSNDDYFTFIKGSWQTTVISSNNLKKNINEIFSKEKLITNFENLTAISVHLGNGHIETPGVMSYILNQVAWNGINLVEVVSTFDELTIIVERKDVENAFRTINNIKN